MTDGIPPPCLADTCGTDALFNLVYLQYYDDGFGLSLMPSLNPLDSTSELYSQTAYYNTGDPFADYFQ
ncbi:MAG: hypothetical protein OEY43_08865 [Gammaproteobacteria bacterium]|nr:hypothetical protein [Gammaproteobacteria bacterium]